MESIENKSEPTRFSVMIDGYRRTIIDQKYKQMTSGFVPEKGIQMSVEHVNLFQLDVADVEVFPMVMGESGKILYDSFCRNVMGGQDPQQGGFYLINWAVGGQELEGIITSILVLYFKDDVWSIFHLWSPACEALKKIMFFTPEKTDARG